MKGLQTLKNDHRLTKKTHKIIAKKCLDPALESFLEDDVVLEDSQISENHQLDINSETFLALDPLLPIPSRESFGSSDLTPSTVSTITKHVIGDNSSVHSSYVMETENSSDMASIVDVETEILVNHLKKAKTQVMNSTGIDLFSRKLVDKLVDVVVEDYMGMTYENDQSEKILAMKFRTLLLSFLPVFLGVMLYLVSYGERNSYIGPPPT